MNRPTTLSPLGRLLCTSLLAPLLLFVAGSDDCTNQQDLDGDGWSVLAGDCNDENPDIHPDAAEVCDLVDNDCDGEIDEGVVVESFPDSDADGFGNDTMASAGCEVPDGFVLTPGDCDDENPEVNPEADEVCDFVDNDCNGEIDDGVVVISFPDSDADGFGNDAMASAGCEVPDGFVLTPGDCDDENPDIHPDAEETCDHIDNDCDGTVDDGLERFAWFLDADADGFGDDTIGIEDCLPPDGYVLDPGDCNDQDPAIHPGALDVCDAADNDCDGQVDEDEPPPAWFQDVDGDGFGSPDASVVACQPPEGYVADASDCNDRDPEINPAAAEVCDRSDNNCDGLVDEGFDTTAYYPDADGDGFGTEENPVESCMPLEGYTPAAGDCNDADAAVFPGAPEACDHQDDDCDGEIDEGLETLMAYLDADGDGFGDPATAVEDCAVPDGYVLDGSDCDDTDPRNAPGLEEVCDFQDNNCDGLVDEGDAAPSSWFPDADGDGFGVPDDPVVDCSQPEGYAPNDTDCDDADPQANPEAEEVCDQIDNDCDGLVDEGDAAPSSWFPDADGDGFGVPDESPIVACEGPEGFADNPDDCNDEDATVNPAADELCDGIDNDCDQRLDEDFVTEQIEPPAENLPLYPDLDGDGFGSNAPLEPCSATDRWVAARGDCNDSDPSIHPGAEDIPGDGLDQDCGGSPDPDPYVGFGPDPAPSIQEALDQAADHAVIWVGAGVYLEANIHFPGKPVTLAAVEAFTGTTIDAQGQGPIFLFDADETQETVVDGFLVTGGSADVGGGISIQSASPTLRHLRVAGNAAEQGGGIYVLAGSPLIEHCRITDNEAVRGGGLFFQGSSGTVRNSVIDANRAVDGAGVSLVFGADLFFNTVVQNNVAENNGGGFLILGRRPLLNTLLVSNNVALEGSGIFVDDASPTIAYSVVEGNEAGNQAALMLVGSQCRPTIYNNVLAYNLGGNLGLQEAEEPPAPSLFNNDLFNPEGQPNHNVADLDPSNLEVEPGFLVYDTDGHPLDFHLALDSPLVDAGKQNFLDVDQSRSDIGMFAGAYGGDWDTDADGVPNYFWPGDLEDAPEGFDPADYDCHDDDPLVTTCP